MSYLLSWSQVSPTPVPMQSVSGGTIIVLLAVILIFSVAFTAGLVIWAIRYKRRKQANP
ncbi:MAG TPA: hypothetical protein VJU86_16595 [Pyrinomonadaceae bacterium]|nr:hypothetical protein [Pyrinomonadaceae bacterium]